ncbi:MAG: tetratricopeptide repeat protein [Propylenella sp.]
MTRLTRRFLRAAALAAVALPALLGAPLIAAPTPENAEPGTLAGAYLAARTADVEKDVESAARFYRQALKIDPENLYLLERSVVLSAAAGDLDEAIAFAERLKQASPDSHVARLVTGVEQIRAGKNAEAVESVGQKGGGVLADLTGALLTAWAAFGAGEAEKALGDLSGLAGEAWYEPYKLLHTGYIALAAGRTDEALKALEAAVKQDGNAVRITEAYARALDAAGRTDEAVKTLEDYMQRFPDDVLARAALASVRGGKGAEEAVRTAVEGAAEALAGVGAAVGQEGGTEVAYLYLRLALHLDPNIAGGRAALALGSLFDANNQGEAAIAAYESIAPDAPFRSLGKLSAALALDRMEKTEDAERAFKAAIAGDPDDIQRYVSYGNMLRGHERFAEAADVYTEAIARVPEPGAADWSLFYYRGVAYERTKAWEKAEADFRRGLELSPDQPLVLNYLGYSLVDMGRNLEEAMEMIRKAVELRPNDGYIVDSLGWAHYRLGDYEDAVKELERAVSLRAEDPVINDHLGDAYWKTGRALEAQFQWRHARDFGAEAEALDIVLKKIAEGKLIEAEAEPVEPEAAEEAAAKPVTLYTVKPGDSLWTISAALLKSGEAFGRIFDANKDKLTNPDMIQPGMELVIPGEI